MARKQSKNSETSSRDSSSGKTSSITKILKWVGIILTLLTLAGSLIGYGIWIGGTNSTISSIKDDIKTLESKETKSSDNLSKLLEKINERLQGFEVLLTKHQSAIEALHNEIRLRHQDEVHLNKLLETSLGKNQYLHRWSRVKRNRVQKALHKEVQLKAAKDSDVAIESANKQLPALLENDPLEDLEF